MIAGRSLLVAAVLVASASACTGDDAPETGTPTSTTPSAGTDASESLPSPDPVSTPSDRLEPPASTPAPTSPPTATGGPAPEPPTSGAAIEIDTGSGTVQIGGGQVPAVVSDRFPVPDGFVVDLASADATSAGFSGTSELGFDELVAFYERELPAAGFEAARRQLVEGRFAIIVFDGPDGRGEIAIAGSPGASGHDVIVTYEP